MALSSTSSSTTQTGKTLDVAGIVSGLMEAENAPVKKLDASISKSTVKITSLGLIKSQLSTLKSALADLQTPQILLSKRQNLAILRTPLQNLLLRLRLQVIRWKSPA